MFTKNMGTADRVIRIVVGIAILAWGWMSSNYLGLIGLVPLATAFMRWCPLYMPFGISTCKKTG